MAVCVCVCECRNFHEKYSTATGTYQLIEFGSNADDCIVWKVINIACCSRNWSLVKMQGLVGFKSFLDEKVLAVGSVGKPTSSKCRANTNWCGWYWMKDYPFSITLKWCFPRPSPSNDPLNSGCCFPLSSERSTIQWTMTRPYHSAYHKHRLFCRKIVITLVTHRHSLSQPHIDSAKWFSNFTKTSTFAIPSKTPWPLTVNDRGCIERLFYQLACQPKVLCK